MTVAMSDGATTTSAAWRAAKACLASCCLLSTAARADGLALGIRRISTLQSGAQELAGPARPSRQISLGQAPPELSRDAYISSLVPAILFAPGSAQLTPSATRILDNLGQSLTAPGLARNRFRIEGHTDTTGSSDANRDLATRRAQAVANYLVQNCSIPATRLEAVASLKPLAPTGDGIPLSLNRRVRLVNLGP